MDEMNHCIEIWMPGGSRRHSLYLTRPGVGPRDNQIALSDVERATERVQKYLAVYLMEVWGWGYTRVPPFFFKDCRFIVISASMGYRV